MLDLLEQLEQQGLLRAVPGVECRGLSALTMTVDKPGTIGGRRGAILSSCAAAPLCWGAENGFEVEENGFLDCRSFLEPTAAQDRDAHWTVGQGGVAGLQMNCGARQSGKW